MAFVQIGRFKRVENILDSTRFMFCDKSNVYICHFLMHFETKIEKYTGNTISVYYTIQTIFIRTRLYLHRNIDA